MQGGARFRASATAVPRQTPRPRAKIGKRLAPIVDVRTVAVVGYHYESFGATTHLQHDHIVSRSRGSLIEAISWSREQQRLGRTGTLFFNLPDCPLDDALIEGLVAMDLRGVVLFLSERHEIEDFSQMESTLIALRSAGAQIGLDHAGTGKDGLRLLARVRPEIVTIDPSLFGDLQGDPTRRTLVKTLLDCSHRLGIAVVAPGLRRVGDLDAVVELGVTYVEGELFRIPNGAPGVLPERIATRLGRIQRGQTHSVASAVKLTAVANCVTGNCGRDNDDLCVEIDEERRPTRLWSRDPHRGAQHRPITMTATMYENTMDLVDRAMLRPPGVRFDPIVVVDRNGLLAGIVRVEDLIRSIATLS
jgi:EAL domain-containing protein (putative c-di-GMP-specific phosphodiesterase class I)